MWRPVLYRVEVGEDVYLGTAEEVVDFMRRAEGAPGGDAASYMEAIAARVERGLGVTGVDTSDPASFLESLGDIGVLRVSTSAEPSDERVDRSTALGDGLIAFSDDIDLDDLDLDLD